MAIIEGVDADRQNGPTRTQDPLSPTREYFSRYVVPGMGMFTEGSTLFSIGNLKPLFAAVWPTCWSTHEICNRGWIDSIEYLEILGIIVGQILVGFEGDWVGRKFGLVQNALIMTLGLVRAPSWKVPCVRGRGRALTI
jgi:hypothetical protein